MKITKRQLKRIIAEEKQRLVEFEFEAGSEEELQLGRIEAAAKASENLYNNFMELRAQLQDAAKEIPGSVANKNQRALLLSIIDDVEDALGDMDIHFNGHVRTMYGGPG